MWKYIKQYLVYAIAAALFMVGEVLMDLIQPGIMSRIVDEGVLGIGRGGVSDAMFILVHGFVMIGLVIFGGLCGSLNNAFVHMSSQNIGNEIRKDCFRKIMSFSFSQSDKYGSGSLITRVTNDITQAQNMIAQFVRGMIRTTMMVVGSLIFMFSLNACFGLIMLGAVPFMIGCMAFCMCKGLPLFSKLQSQLDDINNIMQEDISGIRIIKACVREVYEKIRFGKANDELIKTQLKVLVIFSFMNPVINIIMNVAVVLILLAGSYQAGDGAASPGVIMAAITYSTQLLNGILGLVMLFQNISRGIASWGRLKEILDCENDMRDGDMECSTVSAGAYQGCIEFKNVSFSYPGSNHKVLENINLKIEPGETFAIMGATGSGKSTLVNLIPRFYDATEGQILIDGVDVRDIKMSSLRDKVSIALQKSELFGISIEENIAWGLSDVESVESRVKQAAVVAQADDFISAKKDGYKSMVAQRGASLSGGQKQRVAIARAVFKKAPIQIFDDSTSALDLATEARLYDALEKEGNSTKIIIAQRIASVRRADRIMVLDNGTIAACGTHEQLLDSCEIYSDIYKSQMGGEDSE